MSPGVERRAVVPPVGAALWSGAAGPGPSSPPGDGPGPHPHRVLGAAKSRAIYQRQAAGRREDYAWLRSRQHLTIGEAASRVGVSYRQAQRYEAARRREAAHVA